MEVGSLQKLPSNSRVQDHLFDERWWATNTEPEERVIVKGSC
jgi:hypothetical protein